jgi:hypothetical protein
MLGSRKCNVIHARLRHQCSSLGAVLNIIYICVCVIFVDIIICVLFVGRGQSISCDKVSIEITVYGVIFINNCFLAFV